MSPDRRAISASCYKDEEKPKPWSLPFVGHEILSLPLPKTSRRKIQKTFFPNPRRKILSYILSSVWPPLFLFLSPSLSFSLGERGCEEQKERGREGELVDGPAPSTT